MKERPILFSGEMVRAILAGRKTQTRRIVKFDGSPAMMQAMDWCETRGNGWTWYSAPPEQWPEEYRNAPGKMCPHGVLRERLWAKETHYAFGHWEKADGLKPRKRSGRQRWKFVQDSDKVLFDAPESFRKGRHKEDPQTPAWHRRSSLFLHRKHARITLEIVNVRVERLQDISEADAIAEGVERFEPTPGRTLYRVDQIIAETARLAYDGLWEQINGIGSWAENPWVWVIEFKVAEVRR